jgi:hypothetical protein
MKKIHLILGLELLAFVIIGALIVPRETDHIPDMQEMVPEEPVKEVSHVTPEQEAWLAKLELCESGGKESAINPKDRDGTPSYGLLQFKPSTFELFSKAYGIEGELMDPEAQRAIVRRMMDDKSVRWEKQFPVCVKSIIGKPPGVL